MHTATYRSLRKRNQYTYTIHDARPSKKILAMEKIVTQQRYRHYLLLAQF